MVFYHDRLVFIANDFDFFTIPFSRFVDRVGKDLEKRMGTAIQTIRTKNNPRTQTNTIRPLQGSDTFIIII